VSLRLVGISPLTSTVILREEVAASDGGCHFRDVTHLAGEVAARKFTLSVRSFQVPPTPGTCACPPSLPSVPLREPHGYYFTGERIELVHIVLMVFLSSRISPFTSTVDFARQVTPGDGRGHFGNVSNLAGEVASHRVSTESVTILPRSGDAGNVGLTTESSFGTTSRATRVHFAGEAVELVDHRVKRFLSAEGFRPRTSTVILRERSPLGNRGCELRRCYVPDQ